MEQRLGVRSTNARASRGKFARAVSLGFALILAPAIATAQTRSASDASEIAYAIDLRARPFVRDLASPPSDAPVASIALSLGADLGPHRVASVRHFANGSLVELTRTHRGLDVVGAELFVRVDRAGRVRWVSAHPSTVSSALSIDPELDAADALESAAGPELAATLSGSNHARLVVYAPSGAIGRLAWETRFSTEQPADTYRIYVDAQTGGILAAETRVGRAPQHRARVYDVSPVDGPLIDVTFDALVPGANALEDSDVEILACVDRHRCHDVLTSSGRRRMHHCDLEPTAFVGTDGSFLSHAPPSDDEDPTDGFAEVQAYHHLRSGFAAFRSFASDPAFALANPLTVVVNHRVPDLSSAVALCTTRGVNAPAASELLVEDNAYFWPSGGLGPIELGDRIVLHQGTYADWAYDGEVVWHELTHAVMNTLTELAWHRQDERGVSYEGGGLHEGFSDYFAATISGRSALAYYAGTDDDGAHALGDLEDPHDCRDVMSGEEHDEGEPWSSALWAVRRLLRSQAKRDMFDRALFVVLDGIAQFDGFARVTELVLAELALAAETLIVDQALTPRDASYLRGQVESAEARFLERGLPECDGRVSALALETAKPSLQVVGPIEWGIAAYRGRAIPASVQLEITLDEPANGLRVLVDSSVASDHTFRGSDLPSTPSLRVLIRRDTPITWRWDGASGTDDADYDTALRMFPGSDGLAEVRGAFEPGTYYVQVTNAGNGVLLYDLSIEAVLDGDDPGDRGGGGPSASGCAVHDRSRVPGWLVFFALCFARLRRRAKRG